jgi:hypothetical protein
VVVLPVQREDLGEAVQHPLLAVDLAVGVGGEIVMQPDRANRLGGVQEQRCPEWPVAAEVDHVVELARPEASRPLVVPELVLCRVVPVLADQAAAEVQVSGQVPDLRSVHAADPRELAHEGVDRLLLADDHLGCALRKEGGDIESGVVEVVEQVQG